MEYWVIEDKYGCAGVIAFNEADALSKFDRIEPFRKSLPTSIATWPAVRVKIRRVE